MTTIKATDAMRRHQLVALALLLALAAFAAPLRRVERTQICEFVDVVTLKWS